MSETPKWTAADEAMRWLNEVETVQGGSNGPTIKLRAAILTLGEPVGQLAPMRDALTGLAGWAQMILATDDMPPDLRARFADNHRLTTAVLALAMTPNAPDAGIIQDRLADAIFVLGMVDKNNRIDAGEKGKAWSGRFVVDEVRRVLGGA